MTRTYAGSEPFAAVEAPSNGGKDPTRFLALLPASIGTYAPALCGV